jgi:putative ATPase
LYAINLILHHYIATSGTSFTNQLKISAQTFQFKDAHGKIYTMDLFDYKMEENMRREAPLADRMRPQTLDEIVGQDHIIGEGRLLRRAIQADRLFSSIILYGPPGTGKTTLARVISNLTKAHFESLSAVLTGVGDLRKVIAEATERRKLYQRRTILFVDEVHRWNKSQQDALLPHVETGLLTLIGATTQNPYFDVIKALVSRSRIFEIHALSEDDIRKILLNALSDPENGYGQRQVILSPEALNHLCHMAGGDARNALNALELAVETTPPNEEGVVQINLETAQESIQKRAVLYDKNDDAHYDTISAFIKSIRGSDPDAALYWLAKMLYAGEDPRFILRRLIILAGEDIGLADPMGLVVANAAAQAYEFIGLPEGIFPITEATLYLATAPKSNSALAYFKALEEIEANGAGPVPVHLMDGSRDAKGLGHGQGYDYPHLHNGHWTPQQYLPTSMLGTVFYEPSDQGHEAEVKERVERWREAQAKALADLQKERGQG